MILDLTANERRALLVAIHSDLEKNHRIIDQAIQEDREHEVQERIKHVAELDRIQARLNVRSR